MPDPNFFQEEAKEFATVALNEELREHPDVEVVAVSPRDLYVVWFSKTLKNYKALISTDVLKGVYVEVTFNGETDEAYVDVYDKLSNHGISRAFLADHLAAQALEGPTS